MPDAQLHRWRVACRSSSSRLAYVPGYVMKRAPAVRDLLHGAALRCSSAELTLRWRPALPGPSEHAVAPCRQQQTQRTTGAWAARPPATPPSACSPAGCHAARATPLTPTQHATRRGQLPAWQTYRGRRPWRVPGRARGQSLQRLRGGQTPSRKVRRRPTAACWAGRGACYACKGGGSCACWCNVGRASEELRPVQRAAARPHT